ncbi:MAG TPA: protein kinase [Vicinamibacterales bacterium]|nr:protein kinase [Vicinamibacterales bacterium]
MAIAPGARLGAYEILSRLGAGGMGEVYRARDTRLNRDVAVKVLPDAFVHDAERLARFKREAQVLASLNHPHIAAIYGLEETATGSALVLELVEGPTLADRIARGPVPMDEALTISRQIAEALEAAHEQGIVHRDLKPANIKLTSDDKVKVLDFGLAKALDTSTVGRDFSRADMSLSPTITSPAMTMGGMILGTAAYMSPEQARGKIVDKRSDIWAFGCVMYEMLTGRRAFEGEEITDVLALVITKDPDWAVLASNTPVAIRRLLARCVEKDRSKRLADIADARLDIDDAQTRPAPFEVSGHRRAVRHRWLVPVVSAFAGAVVCVLGISVLRPSRAVPRPAQRFSITIPPSATLPADSPGELALSSDGSRLAYVGTENGLRQLYTRALDQLDATPVRGAEGAYDPFFAPDGEWIGFFSEPGPVSGKLKKIAVRGGPAIGVADAWSPTGGWWGDDGYIYFGTSNSRISQGAVVVRRVSAAGGQPSAVTKIDGTTESRHGWPQLLAGGKAVLFSVRGTSGLYDAGHISVFSSATGEIRTIINSGFHARYVESGHIAYMLGTTLMAVPFDVDRLEVTGSPVPVVERIPNVLGRGQAGFAISSNGLLAYATGVMDISARRLLVWTDRQGQEKPIEAPPRSYLYPRLSPDGSRILLDVRDQQNDIWTWDIARRVLTRLTFGAGIDRIPVWSPDGARVAYTSDSGVVSQSADGSGAIQNHADVTFPSSFTPDGNFMLSWGGVATDQIAVASVAQQSQPTSLKTLIAGRNAEISPSGRWMAYESNESGRWEVYVRAFPDVHAGRWQISTDGGTQPVWSRAGRELFYRSLAGAVMSVAVQADESFRAGSPAKLFEGKYFNGSTGNLARTYDVSADGKRFVMIKDQPSTASSVSPSLVVVLNWFDEVERLVPTGR